MEIGAYIRIKRDGKYQPVDIAECSQEELNSFAEECPEDGWRWAKSLVLWIQNNVKEVPNG